MLVSLENVPGHVHSGLDSVLSAMLQWHWPFLQTWSVLPEWLLFTTDHSTFPCERKSFVIVPWDQQVLFLGALCSERKETQAHSGFCPRSHI